MQISLDTRPADTGRGSLGASAGFSRHAGLILVLSAESTGDVARLAGSEAETDHSLLMRGEQRAN